MHRTMAVGMLSSIMVGIIFGGKAAFVDAIVIPDEERIEGFRQRNYSWPIPNGRIVPNTPGWDRLMRQRIRQVEAMETPHKTEKYDAWVSVMTQALVVPNFTQFGWAVTKAPPTLVEEIQEELRAGFASNYEEGHDPAIVGNHPQLMVDLSPELIDRALSSLLPLHEAWARIPLTPFRGYGLRIYRNTSALYMHLDKASTHVISGILHIDHSIDCQPWPLVIEDLEGITQTVYLNHGDLLFYESAKCLHGRPLPLEGSWYTSLFLHYSPAGNWPLAEEDWAAQYAIPDHWESVMEGEEYLDLPQLQMVDTAMIEPGCPNLWFETGNFNIEASSWPNQAREGVATSSHGIEQVLMDDAREEL